METNTDLRFHRPHLPTAVRQELPQTLREIEVAIGDFIIAVRDSIERPSPQNLERVSASSRLAWTLLLPSRREVLRSNRGIVEDFIEAVERLLQFFLEAARDADAFESVVEDLRRRKSLLDALLASDGERRIRELFAAERRAAIPR